MEYQNFKDYVLKSINGSQNQKTTVLGLSLWFFRRPYINLYYFISVSKNVKKLITY